MYFCDVPFCYLELLKSRFAEAEFWDTMSEVFLVLDKIAKFISKVIISMYNSTIHSLFLKWSYALLIFIERGWKPLVW